MCCCRIPPFFILFPFDCRIGFRRHIVANAVDVFNFLQDTVRDLHQDRPIDRLDSSRHGIYRIDGTDDDRPVERTCIIAYTYGFEVRHNREVLPNLLVQSGFLEFFTQDGIRFANRFQPVACDST